MKNKAKYFILTIAMLVMSGCTLTPQEKTMQASQDYLRGLMFLRQDNIQAAKYNLDNASQGGNTKAQATLASILLFDKNSVTDEDNAKAYQLLQDALKNDEPLAYVGMYYYYRNKNDTVQSAQWLDKAVDKNVSIANYIKANLLITKDAKDEKGNQLLEKSATQGYLPALRMMMLNALKSNNNVDLYVWSSVVINKLSYHDKSYNLDKQLKESALKSLTEQQKITADNKIAAILDEMDKQKQ